ncbi:hypothetical protein AAZX31_07G079800 [Glycine max]|nr:hypothetical protein GLYMA_07G083800v4 [Glycine max]KAG5009316.1 hypothetical protein JHK87_017831 [Glycine soja]KAG5022008.1 hypothetical protein JHK85_018350 [Glycine max]KAG5142190.1 hypothetical protein JHK82_017885 [Glycine max]KAH1085958.1 hypothetical protein GYH30_017775 [Glycine max]
MGNSIRDAFNNSRIPCDIELGRSATMELSTKTRKKFGDDGGFWEDWYVTYTVHGQTCSLCLVRDYDKHDNLNKVSFILLDLGLGFRTLCLHIETTSETGFLRINSTQSIPWTKTNRTVDARDDVVDTKVYLDGNANQRNDLIVLECKKNSTDHDEETNVVTVAHYFADSRGRAFNIDDELGIGLSVVAKVRVSNGQLDITVEGPEQHPASALFCMFDQVNRTGIWKPTMCPHCAQPRSSASAPAA